MLMMSLALERVVCNIEIVELFTELRSVATQALDVLIQVSVPLVSQGQHQSSDTYYLKQTHLQV